MTLLFLGYFKYQKQYDKKIPFTDEFTVKSEILAGYKAFLFCMFVGISFNPLFTFLSNYMEWEHKRKFFLEAMGYQVIFIITIVIFIVLKIVYSKRGVPEKYR